MEYEKEETDEIKKVAETTKETLLARKNMKPPMSQRISTSVSRLLIYNNEILFLCSIITKLKDENKQLKSDIDRIKKLAENGQNS